LASATVRRKLEVRHCHGLERQELCRLSYSGFN
jgi:hypothetical protein